MQRVWRIVDRAFRNTAFTGEGARLYGGRCNSPGTAIVYTAQSQSLAILEQLVHLDSPALLSQYLLFAVDMDPKFIEYLDRSGLPGNWKDDPAPEEVQAIGDGWAANGNSLVLSVPSALVPDESNYLLNPAHADFPRLNIHSPIDRQFDERLSRKHG